MLETRCFDASERIKTGFGDEGAWGSISIQPDLCLRDGLPYYEVRVVDCEPCLDVCIAVHNDMFLMPAESVCDIYIFTVHRQLDAHLRFRN